MQTYTPMIIFFLLSRIVPKFVESGCLNLDGTLFARGLASPCAYSVRTYDEGLLNMLPEGLSKPAGHGRRAVAVQESTFCDFDSHLG